MVSLTRPGDARSIVPTFLRRLEIREAEGAWGSGEGDGDRGGGMAEAGEREVDTRDEGDESSEWSAEIVAGRIANLWRRSFLSSSED